MMAPLGNEKTPAILTKNRHQNAIIVNFAPLALSCKLLLCYFSYNKLKLWLAL